MVIVVAAAAVAAGIYSMRDFVLCGSCVVAVPGVVFRMHVRSLMAQKVGY